MDELSRQKLLEIMKKNYEVQQPYYELLKQEEKEKLTDDIKYRKAVDKEIMRDKIKVEKGYIPYDIYLKTSTKMPIFLKLFDSYLIDIKKNHNLRDIKKASFSLASLINDLTSEQKTVLKSKIQELKDTINSIVPPSAKLQQRRTDEMEHIDDLLLRLEKADRDTELDILKRLDIRKTGRPTGPQSIEDLREAREGEQAISDERDRQLILQQQEQARLQAVK